METVWEFCRLYFLASQKEEQEKKIKGIYDKSFSLIIKEEEKKRDGRDQCGGRK